MYGRKSALTSDGTCTSIVADESSWWLMKRCKVNQLSFTTVLGPGIRILNEMPLAQLGVRDQFTSDRLDRS